VRALGGVRMRAKPVFLCAVVAALGVGADVASKVWALSRLSRGRDITLPGGLIRLQLVINQGAAFGLGARYEPILTAGAFAGVVLLGGPTFNLADVWLRAGALIAVGAWLWQHRTRVARPEASPRQGDQPVAT
jgi:lipoprotein signal peptidase